MPVTTLASCTDLNGPLIAIVKSQVFLLVSNVGCNTAFTQSPGILSGLMSINPDFSALYTNVSHFIALALCPMLYALFPLVFNDFTGYT